MSRPPETLIRRLVEGPSVLSAVEWHPSTGSTNEVARRAAADGAAEVHAVLADHQQAGRGRRGRVWEAPAGTSLLLSLVLRPKVPARARGLLPLLAGLALAEAVETLGLDAALKWPNDLLAWTDPEHPRKAAGILAEGSDAGPAGGAVVLGFGVNVDRLAVGYGDREARVSLAEAADEHVDRWELFAGLVEAFGDRYRAWQEQPEDFLGGYRARCSTIGRSVRVARPVGPPLEGIAVGVGDDGTLEVRDGLGHLHRLSAGDVEHVRTTS